MNVRGRKGNVMGLFGSINSGSSTVNATQMRNAFERHMDSRDIKYACIDEDDNIVYLSFGGSRYDTFVLVDFDEDNDCDSTHFSSVCFARCEKANWAACHVKLNSLNKRFRWIKFWMDEEGKITADTDALVHVDSVGPDCLQICIRMSNILEDALEELEGTASIDLEMKQKLDVIALAKRLGK